MDNSLIDQIRHANDIVDVIQSYIPLKHVGSNWRGICPFHSDTRPSLYISQPKQIFKCFACGKGGNVFTFVQDYEKLSFIEAVKQLARRAGIQIPDQYRSKTVSTKRQQLILIYKTAAEFYSQMLFEHGEGALEYLHNRSFDTQTIKELSLGYALPAQKALLNSLMKEGHGVDILKESGLFGEYSGAVLDLFRDRLIFPIHSHTGDVIAFGGRILEPKENVGKYINSPGTELYTKGKELYGLYKTKYIISKKDQALVCEGYFDFLRLYGSGFDNSVASLGTALTEEQVLLLARYTKKAVMLYDGDSAGIKAAVRGALSCLSRGMEVRIVLFPEKHDPDSYLLQFGKDAMQKLIDNAPDFIQFWASNPKLESPVKERIEMVLDALRSLDDPIQKELYIRQVSEAFGISVNTLFASLKRSSGSYRSAEKPEIKPDFESPEERQSLILALRDVNNYNLLAKELKVDYYTNRLYRRVFTFLQEKLEQNPDTDAAALLDMAEESDLKDILAELLLDEGEFPAINKIIEAIKLRKIENDLKLLDKAIAQDPENQELKAERKKLSRIHSSITTKVVKRLPY